MRSDRTPSADTIASLTGLRGVAALWVMGFHYSWAVVSAGRWPMTGMPVLRDGWAAVDLFFILSGFVLMRGYGAGFARPTRAGLAAYARARAMRVYPVSTFVLAGVVLLVAADRAFAHWFAGLAPGNLSPAALLATLLLADQWVAVPGSWNSPIWSLSAELGGYALLPLLAMALARGESARRLLLGAALLLATMLWTQGRIGAFGINDPTPPASLIRMGFGFATGACLARAAMLAPVGWRGAMPGVAAGSVGAIALLCFVPLGAGLMAGPFATLIFALGFQEGAVDRALRSRPAQVLGRISFPLYLIHFMPGLAFCRRVGTDPAVSDALFFAGLAGLVVAVILLAALVHHQVEAPAQRLARRWSRAGSRERRRPAGQIA